MSGWVPLREGGWRTWCFTPAQQHKRTITRAEVRIQGQPSSAIAKKSGGLRGITLHCWGATRMASSALPIAVAVEGKPTGSGVVYSIADEDDKAPLLVLHHHTNGRAWLRGDGGPWEGWGLQDPLERWSGVAVQGERVVGLKLYLCKLMGFIPQELGSLSCLLYLDLGHNQLFGTIPPEFGALRQLRTLDLYHNQLSGPIPEELGALSELRELSLGSNQLTGSIPAALGRLGSLQVLRLTDNMLSGAIPCELGQLINLKVLKLNGNELAGEIPKELGSLSGLVSLWLNKNNLSGNIPQALGALHLLENLWLKDNKELKYIPMVTKMQLRRKMKGECDIRL
ncbi:Leucine rich repeat protein-likely pseudogene [Ectocarpus siliculosus]|nr:Leucine rich repeat protein-likely pseudogene [Ectocarpus siliculosus]|eukprot:CBJ26934.1 Leucine rich repeat protein-likely pseudogene [Ectocarpus siliculosus]